MTTDMQNFFHITNGDIAAELIKQTAIKGDVIAWQDVLHEGPLPHGLSLAELSEVRARYLSNSGYGSYQKIIHDFTDTIKKLETFHHYNETVLWFEHDLYDQLQLLQLLDWFGKQDLLLPPLSLICIGEHSAVKSFYGFGQLTSSHMDELFPQRKAIDETLLLLGKTAWQAIRSENPQDIECLLSLDLSIMPYLKNALLRYLEEFPSSTNGLTKTEQYILSSVHAGETNLNTIFQQLPEVEGERFMGLGDISFVAIVKRLAQGRSPLITLSGNENVMLALTDSGKSVFHAQQDNVALQGINRWQGGVHFTTDHCWRWNTESQQLMLK